MFGFTKKYKGWDVIEDREVAYAVQASYGDCDYLVAGVYTIPGDHYSPEPQFCPAIKGYVHGQSAPRYDVPSINSIDDAIAVFGCQERCGVGVAFWGCFDNPDDAWREFDVQFERWTEQNPLY